MHRPGARVEGHATLVRESADGSVAACSCGYVAGSALTPGAACLLAVQHLQGAVRDGARVVDDDDGLAGVREPRRPLPPHLETGAVATPEQPPETDGRGRWRRAWS